MRQVSIESKALYCTYRAFDRIIRPISSSVRVVYVHTKMIQMIFVHCFSSLQYNILGDIFLFKSTNKEVLCCGYSSLYVK